MIVLKAWPGLDRHYPTAAARELAPIVCDSQKNTMWLAKNLMSPCQEQATHPHRVMLVRDRM